MMIIHLSRRQSCIIDDEDFALVSRYRWYYVQCKNVGYARTKCPETGKTIYMHKLICPSPQGMRTDHISRDTLDNRKSNLRVCTHAENLHNCGIRKNNKSGYKGVRFDQGKWAVSSTTNGVRTYLGRFEKIEDAVKAYDDHVRSVRDKFAHINALSASYMH